jgi:NAD(P) transhydrogenase subunit alpha
MKVAVLRETRPGERRVAMVPAEVTFLKDKAGLDVHVEAGAGVAAGFPDQAFREAGANVTGDLGELLRGADMVLKVAPPTMDDSDGRNEVGALPADSILISFLSPTDNLDMVKALVAGRITAMGMEAVPRITRAQKMDALSSQATVAGYAAVLVGATNMVKFLPMFTTAAGTIRPGKALILGAGVAGLQAIATSKRLGAKVEAFDVRPAVKEQVESLGAKFVEAELDESAEDEGGYAKVRDADQAEKDRQLIAAHIVDADLVISTAQIPGRAAPELITTEMVESMAPGSVIMDLAASTGGNCKLTRPDEIVEHKGVTIMGPTNLPSMLPLHASQMYARNVREFIMELLDAETKELNLDFENEVIAGSAITHGGEVRHGPTKEKLNG